MELLPFSTKVQIRSRGYTPHWEIDHAIYFITYRLADSLPRNVIAELKREFDVITRQVAGDVDANALQRATIRSRFVRRLDAHLDHGYGNCHLRDHEIAACVVETWKCFDPDRYRLIAWCVMPDHAHVIIHLMTGSELSKVVHSWKSFTANFANRVLRRRGAFWYREYYDHCIRSESELERTVRYVLENPLRIGLTDWPFVGCAGW